MRTAIERDSQNAEHTGIGPRGRYSRAQILVRIPARRRVTPVTRVDAAALKQLAHPITFALRPGNAHPFEKRRHVRRLPNGDEQTFGQRLWLGHAPSLNGSYDSPSRLFTGSEAQPV